MYTNLLAAFQSMEQWPDGEEANDVTCRWVGCREHFLPPVNE